MKTTVKLFTFGSWLIAVVVDFVSLKDMKWDSQFVELFFLFGKLFGHWLVGFLGLVCLAIAFMSFVRQNRFLMEQKDQTQVLIICGVFLLAVCTTAFPFLWQKIKVCRYYFGPVSIAYLESKGNYKVAADRAETLASSKRWQFIRDDLLKFAEFLRSKDALSSYIEEERIRLRGGNIVEDMKEVELFRDYFAGATMVAGVHKSELNKLRKAPAEIRYLESLGVVEQLNLKSKKFH